MSLFTKLFDTGRDTADGLTQHQREAIIDLLVLGMYVDNTLSLSEEAVLNTQLDSFAWEGKLDLDYYVNNTVARVRDIRSSESAVADLLKSISERLNDYENRLNAVGICERLLAADGKAEQEKAFLEKVRTALELN